MNGVMSQFVIQVMNKVFTVERVGVCIRAGTICLSPDLILSQYFGSDFLSYIYTSIVF